jgi:hypothetical protein
VPLSSPDETEKYTGQAILRTGAIQGGTKVGRLQYVIGKYENLIRATIPIVSETSNKFYLMLSLDESCNPVTIIEDKVLPQIDKCIQQL